RCDAVDQHRPPRHGRPKLVDYTGLLIDSPTTASHRPGLRRNPGPASTGTMDRLGWNTQYQPSSHWKMAMRASAWLLKRRRLSTSRSSVAKKLSAIALS